MSGRTSSDGDIIRHQQEKDLGHETPEPGHDDDRQPRRQGTGGEDTGREHAPDHDDPARQKSDR